MTCHLGDFPEYAALRHQLQRLEKDAARQRAASRRTEAAISLETLKVGDVIRIPAGRREGWAVVVATPARGARRHGAPSVVTEDRKLWRLTLDDVPTPVEAVTTLRVPKGFNAKSPKERRDLATSLRVAVPHDPPPSRREAAATAAAEAAEVEELRRRSAPTRATSAPTARRTRGGPSGGGG